MPQSKSSDFFSASAPSYDSWHLDNASSHNQYVKFASCTVVCERLIGMCDLHALLGSDHYLGIRDVRCQNFRFAIGFMPEKIFTSKVLPSSRGHGDDQQVFHGNRPSRENGQVLSRRWFRGLKIGQACYHGRGEECNITGRIEVSNSCASTKFEGEGRIF